VELAWFGSRASENIIQMLPSVRIASMGARRINHIVAGNHFGSGDGDLPLMPVMAWVR
jgi:hypothetical protein